MRGKKEVKRISTQRSGRPLVKQVMSAYKRYWSEAIDGNLKSLVDRYFSANYD